jgi:ABC-type transporter Mla subunit MlaD
MINQFRLNLMKGATMKARIALGSIVLMFVMALPANAGGKDELQKYFSNVALKVKATENASQKREILNESFQSMSKALDKVQSLALISKDDRVGIDRFKATLQEKQDELAGNNGFVRVSDEQLNDFSDYVVQDMEQAAVMITISVVALLIILLLVVLLF